MTTMRHFANMTNATASARSAAASSSCANFGIIILSGVALAASVLIILLGALVPVFSALAIVAAGVSASLLKIPFESGRFRS